jgi:hypothetical protein
VISAHLSALEGFKATLVDRSSFGALAMRMPPLRVRDRDPTQHLGQFSIVSGPQQQMPVIRHETMGSNPNPIPFIGLF